MCSNIKRRWYMPGVSGTFEVCLSHPSFCELKTGRHHRRRFNLNVCVGFLGRVWWVSGCGLEWFPRDLLFPPVSVLHLLGVGDRCTGTGAVHSAVGRPGLPQPAVNPQMWRVGGFYCYSISGRFSPPCALLYGDVRQKLGEKPLGPRERIHLLNTPNSRVNR